MNSQVTNIIMMVRPARFKFNRQTAVSNAFQKEILNLSDEEILTKAQQEFDEFVSLLRINGINVMVIEDSKEPEKPDAIFPNNWISMHQNGQVFLYPMCTPNRRLERRKEVIDEINKKFIINELIDLSSSESENLFLEGTGSIIFDHPSQTAFACISPRTDLNTYIKHCKTLGYEPIYFNSEDINGNLIYHTNVMLTIGVEFAVICLETIKNDLEKKIVVETLKKSGNEIIEISESQMNCFAGNMLQLKNDKDELILVMSLSAYNSLNTKQILQIEKHTKILKANIPTIETIGGGSARCMIAEIFLKEK